MFDAWLISSEAHGRLVSVMLEALRRPIDAASLARNGGTTAPSTVSGGVATIQVRGVLTAQPNPILALFGGGNVAYPDLVAALRQADESRDVRSIVLEIDSPGGQVSGLFETIGAIRSVGKPISVVAHSAESAAYAIASAAGPIRAASPVSSFGSVGVVVSLPMQSDVVEITSSEAPDKRPDVSTEEGRAVVRDYLDGIHALFAEAIAEGRGVSVDAVNAGFGRGRTYVAREAHARGMIDSIAEMPRRERSHNTITAEVGRAVTNGTQMDLATIKAQHPDLAEALRAEGAERERERASAHLILAEASGDMASAIEAIKSGSPVDQITQARHLAAAINRRDTQARQHDSDAAATALASAPAPAVSEHDEFIRAFRAAQMEA